jgi:VRR-NUC domain
MPRRKPQRAQLTLSGPAFRKLIDGQLTERAYQRQVEEALGVYRWDPVYHIPPNVIVCRACGAKNYRGIERGFPDIFALREPYQLWLELKGERGRLEPEQRRTTDLLQVCNQPIVLPGIRPRDRERLFDVIAHPETFHP